MTIWRWADRLEAVPQDARVTLGEGDTPLVRSRRLGPELGMSHLYFKLETTNPTGSYKDRFGAAAISHMVAAGQTKCIATSSGNTGAALAAYCAAANIECRIAIVETAPMGKLKQMLSYGAKLARVRGFGTDPQITDDVIARLQEIGQRPEWALQISAFVHSPLGMSGVQSVGFELAEQMQGRVDRVFCPAGSGGLCIATAQGFLQLHQQGQLPNCPRVECVQPEGNNTVAGPLREGAAKARSVNCTSTISGLQVASVIDGDLAVEACRATGGTGYLVTDEEVWETQKVLARTEGVFAEPAGAASVAAVVKARRAQQLDADEIVVCMITGSGFKDDSAVDRMVGADACPLAEAADLDSW